MSHRVSGVVFAASLVVLVSQIYLSALPQGPAQSTSAKLAFEVASVKPNRSGPGPSMIPMPVGGRYSATNVPLRALIRNAYGLQDTQLVGAPDWIRTERFDIVAKAEGNPPLGVPGGPPGPYQQMLQSLLEDRFKLKVHRETRDMPIYALALATRDGKLGPRLAPSKTDCQAIIAQAQAGGPPMQFPQAGRPPCGLRMFPGDMSGGAISMTALATALSPLMQRWVVNRTGLEGNFDVDLSWTPDQMPAGAPPPGAPPLPPIDPNGPSIFTALQEQLGLRLESTTGPVDVVVVDHVEQPTPD